MRETPNTTALLIEYGFIDNINDQKKLNTYLLDYAEAVVRATMNYINLPYVAPGTTIEDTYTVKKGDTLYSISKRFNISIDRIKELNNLDSNILSIGQVLVLDDNINIIPDDSKGIIYIVKQGDTLYKIAKENNTTVDDILSLNNLDDILLSIGQELLLPDGNNKYIVEKGDSLYSISRKFNTTVEELKLLNNLSSNLLSIGQELIIP